MRERIVAANWKMHGSRAFLERWFEAVTRPGLPPGVRVVAFPPMVLLAPAVAAATESPVAIGVQTLHPEPEGAFTGETSAELARDAGAGWALVGHSERRLLFGESDAAVVARMGAAARAGLRAVLCVGETLAQRRAGGAERVVLEQLGAVLEGAPEALAAVAYEPVWAIGTGETATPEQAQAMHAVVREALAAVDRQELPVLYGGSVKTDNAAALLACPDIDGALVGGASLDPEQFRAIVGAAVE
jgi:triosephosphate isomerase